MSRNKIQKAKFQNSPVADAPDVAPAPSANPVPGEVISTAVSPSGAWITDKAWVCGVVGALTVLFCAAWYKATGALENGVFIGGFKLTSNRIDTLLLALVISTAAMLVVEVTRLWMWDRKNFFCIDPDIRAGRYSHFLVNCLVNFILNLCLLGLVILFFHTAGEYGYQNKSAFYQPWFRFLDLAWVTYLWAGLPYAILTLALKYSPAADRRDTTSLLVKILAWMGTSIALGWNKRPRFDDADKKCARALLVKLFFTPIMTVFFADQFPHLVNNVGYMFGYLLNVIPEAIASGARTHAQFNRDYFNVSIALIFSIDVALAWCGYVVSSRWVDNQTASAEPTMLGWMVCIICYPPFQMFLGLYYASPNEQDFMLFSNQGLVTLFTTMMLLSYFVYMAATLWFGVRFSNLTNRGIIRKGPFAFIRHPAYASKNFAWWCVMFPTVVYNATHTGLQIAILQIIGLVMMTWVYYLRALTEERHLSVDPAYREYCKQVRYRFIPGVI
jgi:protein-S-isoprenylcysteine O-methyltransferase Ste14